MTEAEWLASDDPAEMLRHLTHDRESPNGIGVLETPRTTPLASDRKLGLWVEACRLRWRRDDRHFVNYDIEAGGLAAALDAWSECRQTVMPINPLPERAAILRDIVGNPFRPVTLQPADDSRYYGYCEAAALRAGMILQRWLVPTVLSLAQAAYEERWAKKCKNCRGETIVECRREEGDGRTRGGHPVKPCPACYGTGTIEDGTLDPARLAILSDALEEAGCDNAELLGHLRQGSNLCPVSYQHLHHDLCDGTPATSRRPGPHYRGCWAVDLILGNS